MKFLLLIAVLWCIPAQARIGETPEQIRARYGPALPQSGFVNDGEFLPGKSDSEVHEKNGIYVEVRYLEGRCAWIMYAKKAIHHGSVPTFTREEVATLQSVCAPNAPDLAAKERISGEEDDVFVFRTPDGTLTTRAATHDGQHFKQLVAYTDAWDTKVLSENAAAEARKLQDVKKALSGF